MKLSPKRRAWGRLKNESSAQKKKNSTLDFGKKCFDAQAARRIDNNIIIIYNYARMHSIACSEFRTKYAAIYGRADTSGRYTNNNTPVYESS